MQSPSQSPLRHRLGCGCCCCTGHNTGGHTSTTCQSVELSFSREKCLGCSSAISLWKAVWLTINVYILRDSSYHLLQHPASHVASLHSIPFLLHTLCWLRWRSLVTSSDLRLPACIFTHSFARVSPPTIFSLRTFACGLQPGLSEDRVRFFPHLHRLTKSHLSQ